MFLIVVLAIVVVCALLGWVLLRERERAGGLPQRPDSSLWRPGDGHTHHGGHTDYGGGHLGGGQESGGQVGGGHGF